jgi:hypothetical protein
MVGKAVVNQVTRLKTGSSKGSGRAIDIDFKALRFVNWTRRLKNPTQGRRRYREHPSERWMTRLLSDQIRFAGDGKLRECIETRQPVRRHATQPVSVKRRMLTRMNQSAIQRTQKIRGSLLRTARLKEVQASLSHRTQASQRLRRR